MPRAKKVSKKFLLKKTTVLCPSRSYYSFPYGKKTFIRKCFPSLYCDLLGILGNIL